VTICKTTQVDRIIKNECNQMIASGCRLASAFPLVRVPNRASECESLATAHFLWSRRGQANHLTLSPSFIPFSSTPLHFVGIQRASHNTKQALISFSSCVDDSYLGPVERIRKWAFSCKLMRQIQPRVDAVSTFYSSRSTTQTHATFRLHKETRLHLSSFSST
jgi:hypothetical protein